VRLKDFRKIRKLGEGGFGKVYHVVHRNSKKSYAMKVIYKAKIEDDK
jgi:serine/threonine protein kinase